MSPLPVLLHPGDVHPAAAATGSVDAQVGSPLYDVPAEHLPALLALLALPLIAWAIRAFAPRWSIAGRWVDGYRALPALERLAAWLLAASGVIHLALVGHHTGLLGLLVVLDGALQLGLAWAIVWGRRWRAAAVLVLSGSIIGWWLTALAVEPGDQLSVLTKLIEITALAIAIMPRSRARIRGALVPVLVITLVVITDVAAWAGAFRGASAGHHAGNTPSPGTLLPSGHDREPTDSERATADALWAATIAALAPYQDVRVAAAAGYDVAGIRGIDFHAPNQAYQDDDRILDPAHPEDLIYAQGPAGPVLLGAMFEMPLGGGPGPSVGGPLTVWHGHEQVCFGLVPPGIAGLASPFGGCPVGAIGIARTPEMIHVWTVPGSPVHWGELDDAWRLAYLASLRP